MKVAVPLLKALVLASFLAVVALTPVEQISAQAPTPIPPPPGMVSWWPGDGNANDIINGNDGTLIGGATFAQGKVGQAFSFDGLDDRVDIDDTAKLRPQQVTLDAWVNLHNQQACIICKQVGGNSNNSYALWIDFGQLHSWVSTDLGNAHAIGPIVPVGTFFHAATTWDGSVLKLYLDGALVASDTLPGATIQYDSNPVLLGADDNGVDLFVNLLDGLIDEAEIFDRALSDNEIEAIFDAGSAGKIKPTPPCTLDLELSYIDTTLTMDFNLGTPEPAIWSTWLFVGTTPIRLWSAPIPVFEPPVSFPVPIPGFPSIGKVIVLTWLATSEGITCWDSKAVETGVPSSAVPSISELRELLPEPSKVLWNVH